MSEVGNFESFAGAPAGNESSEQAQEQFNEEMRRAQAAQQQLKKEEGKARGNDNKLANIIVQFLSQASNTDLFLLISRCVAQDIPSELLIAVLSLIDRTASMEIDQIVAAAQNKNALTVPKQQAIHSLSEGQMQAIEKWLGDITVAAANKPHRTLESVLRKKVNDRNEMVKELSAPFVQLSAFILRNYLAMQSTQVDYEILHDFMQSAYLKMITDLEELVVGQKRIG